MFDWLISNTKGGPVAWASVLRVLPPRDTLRLLFYVRPFRLCEGRTLARSTADIHAHPASETFVCSAWSRHQVHAVSDDSAAAFYSQTGLPSSTVASTFVALDMLLHWARSCLASRALTMR